MVESHQRRHLKADKTIAGQPGRQEFSTRASQRSRIPSVLGSLARIVRLRSRLEVTFVVGRDGVGEGSRVEGEEGISVAKRSVNVTEGEG